MKSMSAPALRVLYVLLFPAGLYNRNLKYKLEVVKRHFFPQDALQNMALMFTF